MVAKAQVAVAGAEKERGESEQPGCGASRHRRTAGVGRRRLLAKSFNDGIFRAGVALGIQGLLGWQPHLAPSAPYFRERLIRGRMFGSSQFPLQLQFLAPNVWRAILPPHLWRAALQLW